MLQLPLGRGLMAGPTLRLGSRGEEVRRLQELLRARGYRVQSDGYFGGSTYGAVLNLQQREGIPADGVAGPSTWQALGQAPQAMTARPPATAPGERAEWNVMIYMAGNNNLSDAAGRDLEELRAVQSYNGVRVTAFVKRQNTAGRAQHMEVSPGGAPDLIEELRAPVDSGNPQTVLDFVRWATRRAPARRYALVIWNHGGGWTPDDLDQLYTQVRGRSVRRDIESGYVRRSPRMTADGEPAYSELTRLAETPEITKAVFTTSLAEVLKLPDAQERAIASDDGTLHSLDTIELCNVMRRVHEELGRPIDLLGMDACLMSNLEVCYELREHVGTVVGSEELEPNEGWPYTEILSAMAANPRMDARELGRIIVEEYLKSYRGTRQTVTQCAVDVTRIEEFMREFETLAGGLRRQVEVNRSVVDSVQSVSTRFHVDRSLVDLRTMCLALVADSRTDPTLASVADKLLAIQAPGGFVIQEGHQGDKVEGCGGLSAYFPMERTISRYYADLQLAQHTDWDEFLREYGNARTIRR
ncbi:clostripain-related cysteine peptidase [Nonomuraea zeae]